MDFSALNSFDYLVLFIVLISVLFGFLKGFVRSVLSLAGWIAAGYIAYTGFPLVKPFLLTHFSNEMAVNVGGPVAVYFVAIILVSLVNYQIISVLGGICGSMIDRSLGFALGFVRGTLIVTVAFIGLTMIAPGLAPDKTHDNYQSQAAETDKAAPEWLKKAQTYGLLKISSAMLVSSIPADLTNKTQQIFGANKKSTPSQGMLLEAANVVQQMQMLIPKNLQMDSVDVSALSAVPTEAGDKQRKEIFRIILDAYKTSVKAGKIPPSQAISDENIKKLENAIATPYVSGVAVKEGEKPASKNPSGAGYDKKQINEFDRLIQTVQ